MLCMLAGGGGGGGGGRGEGRYLWDSVVQAWLSSSESMLSDNHIVTQWYMYNVMFAFYVHRSCTCMCLHSPALVITVAKQLL